MVGQTEVPSLPQSSASYLPDHTTLAILTTLVTQPSSSGQKGTGSLV